MPSASIAIVIDGRIAYLQAYGQARLSPPMEATPQMQYSIGSISKQFTAAAVLLLAQENKLTLDDPVCEISSRPDSRQRSDHPHAAFTHLGLPGLLA